MATFAILFPETGITVERIVLILIYSLSLVKMLELLGK